MLRIAVTGSIAAGKSTVLALFGAHMPVLDLDRLVDACYRDPAVRARLEQALGTADKKVLARRVFGDRRRLRVLEAILHPEVRKRLEAWLEARAREGAAAVAVEVPLLYEAGWEALFDRAVAVTAADTVQEARLAARGLSAREIEARVGAQLPAEVKAVRADAVVSGEDQALARRQVEKLLAAWGITKQPRARREAGPEKKRAQARGAVRGEKARQKSG